MKKLEGKVVGEGIKVGIVASRFNEFIVSKLVGGAQDALVRHGVEDDDITWLLRKWLSQVNLTQLFVLER